MHHAVAGELGVLKPRDHREHPLLLAPLEARLEAHQVVQRGLGVLLPELHHGVGFLPRAGIDEPHRLQRSESQRLAAPGGQYLHGQAALEHQLLFKVVQLRQLRADQRVVEGVVLVLGHRAVEVVVRPPAVTGGAEDLGHVQRFRGDDGRGGVEEVQRLHAGVARDGIAKRRVGQRPGGDDGGTLGDLLHEFRRAFYEGVALDRRSDPVREQVAVHRQRAPRGHPGGLPR